MLDSIDELLTVAIAHDFEAPALDRDIELARVERADKHDLLRALADVDEAARARELGAELADVEIAVAIRLRETQERNVEAAAVVEIELVGLIDDRLRVGRGAEVQAARRNAADHAGLGRHREEIDHL